MAPHCCVKKENNSIKNTSKYYVYNFEKNKTTDVQIEKKTFIILPHNASIHVEQMYQIKLFIPKEN